MTLAHVARERTGHSEVCQGRNESCDFEKTSVMLCCCWVLAFHPNILFASTQAKELGSFWNKSNIHFYGYGSSTMHTGNIYLPAENWKTKQSWCIHTHTLAWMYAHVYTHACRYTHTMHYEIMDFFEVLREVKGTVILQCYCKIMWNMIRNVFNVGCARLNQS